MDCPDCCDKGCSGGCDECGRERPATAEELEAAEWDRQDAAKAAAAPVPAYRTHRYAR